MPRLYIKFLEIMEIDELKQQWELLHQKLDEQELVNKRLMENMILQKMDFINSYNWIGVAIGIAAIPIILFINQQSKQIDNGLMIFIISMLSFSVFIGIYKALQFNKTKSFKTNIIEKERNLLRHQKISFGYYLTSIVVLFAFFIVIAFFYYDRLVEYNRLWFFVTIIVVAMFAGIREMKWYLGKVKKLQQSISALKEFEKE